VRNNEVVLVGRWDDENGEQQQALGDATTLQKARSNYEEVERILKE
jgi:hypothetical protein